MTRADVLKESKALGTAQNRKVEVDHGETGCKTPDAVPYIRKAVAHRRNKKRS